MSGNRILVALKPEPLPTVLRALEGYEFLVAHDMKEATKLIVEKDFDLFVIGILFDESAGMELIKQIRLGERNRGVPVFVTRFMPSQHEDMLRQVLGTMIALGTVSDYFEADWQASGIETTIRTRIEKLLLADAPLAKTKARKSNNK